MRTIRLGAAIAASMLASAVAAACGGNGNNPGEDAGTDAADAAPQSVTVTGTVLDREGFALAGVSVFVSGSSPMVTNGSGQFTITGVTPPYDVYIASAEANAGTLYEGLTRTDPVLDALFVVGDDSFGNVTGTLAANGSTFTSPNPADTTTWFYFNHSRGTSRIGASPGDIVSTFSQLCFFNGPMVGGTMHVMQFTETGGDISAFHGYAQTSFTGLTHTGMQAVGSLNMNPVALQSISGTISTSPDFAVAQVSSGATLFDGTPLQLVDVAGAASSFDFNIPAILGAFGRVTVTAIPSTPMGSAGVFYTRAGIALPTSGIAIEIPDYDLPQATAPAMGATGIGVGDTISWQPVEDTVFLASIQGPEGAAQIRVITTRNSITIPDFAAYGVTIPSGAAYTSRALGFPEYATTDAIAVPDRMRQISRMEVTGVALVGTSRAFTTE